MAAVSVITPAFEAGRFIAHAARSVLDQTFADWQWMVIADDGADYEAMLAANGLRDPRFRFISSGAIRGGASRARNVALDQIDTPFVAILDADDRLKPEKLARAIAALESYPVVSTALDVMTDNFAPLRLVGQGPDRAMSPAEHKFTSLSMDSMILWDRRRTDARYDLEITNMTDLELLMQLYRRAERSFHLGAPLHDYVKLTVSMSNGPGVTEKMIRSKRELLRRLEAGSYPMADAAGPEGIAKFLRISLVAEETYPAAMAERPGLLFEDHLEPMLRAL